MSVDAGSVFTSVRVRLSDLDNDLKGVYARLNQLEANITKNTTKGASSFKDMFKAVVSGQAVLDLARRGFDALKNAVVSSIRVSTEAQEVISKYDQVFQGMGDASEEAADRFADSFDLANATAKEMLSNTGNLLQGFGATREESLRLSEQVNVLASDLASFTNNQGGAKVASEALTKALLGEREQAKTLGIAILESDVQARLAQKGQTDLTGTSLKLAKAQATLELITEQAKNSIGDYARTADSAANTQKRAGEKTKELQIALGQFLTPAVTILASAWGSVAGKIAEVLAEHNKLSAAQKADREGNATLEQRMLLVQQEKKGLEQLLVAEKNIAAQYGIADTEEGKRLKAQIQGIDAQLAGMKRFQDAVKKGEMTRAEAAAKAEADAKARQALDEKYLEQREKIKAILEDNKGEYSVLQGQIDELSLSWKEGSSLENERLEALGILKGKQQEIIDGALKLGEAEKDNVETSRKAAIADLDKLGILEEAPKLYDDLLKRINKYYDLLSDKEAVDRFVENARTAIDGVSSLFSALSSYYDAVYEQRINLLDSEMAAEMEAAGVAEDTAVEKAQKEYDAAVAGGDAETIAESKQALERAKIEEKYQKKKAELEYKSSMASWKLQVGMAVAQMAQAILNAYSSAAAIPVVGWTLAPVAAGIAAIASGIQLAAVMAAKPVKTYATGGIVPGNPSAGDSVPALLTPREVILNEDQQSRLFNMLNGSGGAGNGVITIHNEVILDGEPVAKNTASYINKGLVRLNA